MDALRELIDIVQGLLLSLGQTVSVWDVIDILIVAILIYRVLSILRKTSASSVINGLVFLLAVAGASYLLNMHLLAYLLRQVLQMGILVIVVLFQPEIRKMFEQMGVNQLGILFKKRGRFTYIDAGIQSVVAASEAMAKENIGALIVMEREVGLNDYAVTGTRIDANSTPELIQNVFYPNSPLHDGALIVRDGRLLAAACMLPLTNNVNLGRDLGMRHRAGVGMSERSDAVVVIVSEQTASISVAIDGMLKRHLDKDTFEKLLRNELIKGEGSKRKKKKTRKQKESS